MLARYTRRQFLKASAAIGGGFALNFRFPFALAAGAATEINAWVVVHADDRVIIRIARSEMGQGTFTALAQLVAEELDCDWAKVTPEFASPNEHVRRNRVWGSMSTGGSNGVRSSQDYVRKAGAAARIMLVQAAAARWRVPVNECAAASGIITHRPTQRTLRYGEVAADAAQLKPPANPALRAAADWHVAGKPVARFDIPDKVRGKPVFGADVVLPGMLHASIAQCPVFGGSLRAVDSSAAQTMRGVHQVVRATNFVAVVADNWWRANEAVKSLKIDWDLGEYARASNASIAAMLRAGLDAPDLPPARSQGDTASALASAARIVEAEYSSPYLNHATMETQTCTAWFRPDGFLEVWTSTQDGEASLAAAARTAGLPQERVEVHKMMLGGGFGRRGAHQDYVVQAVTIARSLNGRPVKLMWSREEDMQHDFYRPASVVRMKAGLDARGRVVAMHSRIACPSILAGLDRSGQAPKIDFTAVRSLHDMPYTIPNQQVDYAMRNGHVPVGFWRAPGQQNAYYRECFIDELAHAAGRDPVDFRLAMLAPEDKNRGVLAAVAKAARWGSPTPAGVHRGVAVVNGFGSYAAMVAELAVSASGELVIHRIVLAIDSGYVVNPDTCRAQAESNVIYGLGSILYQEINIRDGRSVESNFGDFRLPQISEMPKVETVLVPTGGFWGGHGEPGILPLPAAICNAIFAATGKRVRSLPLKHHDLRRA